MTEYKLKDGGTITAVDPQDFVTKIRMSSKFDSGVPDDEYMVNFAERYFTQTSFQIRCDSHENFVEDLKETGYIL